MRRSRGQARRQAGVGNNRSLSGLVCPPLKAHNPQAPASQGQRPYRAERYREYDQNFMINEQDISPLWQTHSGGAPVTPPPAARGSLAGRLASQAACRAAALV